MRPPPSETLQPNRPETRFLPPVWISSVDHLDQFAAIIDGSSLFSRLLGIYKLPEGFPFVQNWFVPFMRFPIIYFANGHLAASAERLRFEALPRSFFGSSVIHLRLDLQFEICSEQIRSFEPFRFDNTQLPFPATRYFNFPWTRVRTTATGMASDLLIGLGGHGPSMNRIHRKNEEFLHWMMSFQAR